MTGEDQPSPSTATFQTTPVSSLHLTGSPVCADRPWPLGPRNWGHSAPDAAPGKKPASVTTAREVTTARDTKNRREDRINTRYPFLGNRKLPLATASLSVAKCRVQLSV